jgi:hypothetical protein
MLFAAVHESGGGTFETCRPAVTMSVPGGFRPAAIVDANTNFLRVSNIDRHLGGAEARLRFCAFGTNRTSRVGALMSVRRGRPEVSVARSK